MKKVLFSLFILLYCNFYFPQASKSANNSVNFIIGLPKISSVQLELLKIDLNDLPQIIKAEFIFKEHCLLIISDHKTSEPLKYEHIEKVLLKYFGPSDIYKKETVTFEELWVENVKSDKYIIK